MTSVSMTWPVNLKSYSFSNTGKSKPIILWPIKASAVALNPFILFEVAGSFALDTALIRELSKIYGLNLKSESIRKIFKNEAKSNWRL